MEKGSGEKKKKNRAQARSVSRPGCEQVRACVYICLSVRVRACLLGAPRDLEGELLLFLFIYLLARLCPPCISFMDLEEQTLQEWLHQSQPGGAAAAFVAFAALAIYKPALNKPEQDLGGSHGPQWTR